MDLIEERVIPNVYSIRKQVDLMASQPPPGHLHPTMREGDRGGRDSREPKMNPNYRGNRGYYHNRGRGGGGGHYQQQQQHQQQPYQHRKDAIRQMTKWQTRSIEDARSFLQQITNQLVNRSNIAILFFFVQTS
jgi:hypothetical protein